MGRGNLLAFMEIELGERGVGFMYDSFYIYHFRIDCILAYAYEWASMF